MHSIKDNVTPESKEARGVSDRANREKLDGLVSMMKAGAPLAAPATIAGDDPGSPVHSPENGPRDPTTATIARLSGRYESWRDER
ncbi:hypothetical protein BBP40_005798 [Aspergillus hancockii]|nr:hypothetical protein BBP40_005798 [Aspergillus hancockii]